MLLFLHDITFPSLTFSRIVLSTLSYVLGFSGEKQLFKILLRILILKCLVRYFLSSIGSEDFLSLSLSSFTDMAYFILSLIMDMKSRAMKLKDMGIGAVYRKGIHVL